MNDKTMKEFLCSTIRKTVLKNMPDIPKRELDLFISNIYEMTLLHINNMSKGNILYYIGCKLLVNGYNDNLEPIESNTKFDLEFWYKAVEEITTNLNNITNLEGEFQGKNAPNKGKKFVVKRKTKTPKVAWE